MTSAHEIINPYTSGIIRSVRLSSPDDLDSMITRSTEAFEHTKAAPAFRRAELLRTLAGAIAEHATDYASSIMAETGKPITMALGEVQRAIATLTGASDEATRINGETLPLDTASGGIGKTGITRRFPIGPITAISPFNFPLNLGMHKVAPALAAGNTVIWKPPLQSSGAAELFLVDFLKVANQLNFPEDALQVVICEDSVAEILVTDPRIKMLSFTGSSRVGWQLKAKAGIKRVTLELGGNAAVVIANDADVDFAAKRCAIGGFGFAGQTCISVQRVIVHESMHDKFLQRFVDATEALSVGDPESDTTVVGPMISEKEADRVEEWVYEAITGGATWHCGGERSGQTIPPIILSNVTPEMRLVSQEVFGPVVTVQRFDSWDDGLRMVNSSVYGLQAGIFTNNIQQIWRAFEMLEVGGIIVNDIPGFRVDSMPYGGVKESGLGREGMRYAIREMTDERLLVI